MATVQRLTLYGFFDSLEGDLISLIRRYADPSQGSFILSPDQRDNAKKVLTKRGRDGSYNLSDDLDLLFGLNVGDKYSVLMQCKKQMDAATLSYFRALSEDFKKAIPIRNDVMHGRPLTAEDHSFTYALVSQLLTSANRWPCLAKFHRDVVENPSSVIAKNYEIFDTEVIEESLHNLPVADYDDTGFVRRLDLEKELKRKILSRHPVITVLGDGGNGKSALALQTAYNLVNSNDHEFDAIAWVTAKSSVLTGKEIERIAGAITNSLELFDAVSDDFSEPGDDPQERIMKLLTDNAVLLFIDNLETALDDRLKDFAENLPGKSKLVFTSRVPLGSDLSVIVSPFNDSEAVTLFRRLVDSYSIGEIDGFTDKKILKITRKLGNKPLLIKWFARGVSSGLTPQSILAKKDIAVQYCLENVFDKLSSDGMSAAQVYAVIPSRLSPNVVQKLSGLSALKIESAIAELSRFAIISNSGSKAYENTYEMSDFARRFLNHSGTSDSAKDIRKKYQQVLGALQSERANIRYNKYSMSSYTVRSNQEAMSKSELQRAYRLAKAGGYEEALAIIEEQKTLNSQYFEVYRVSAGIYTEMREISKASDDYAQAVDLAPSVPQLRAWYASFLMINLNDNEGAALQFDEALTLDKSDFLVFNDAIRNQFYIPDFGRAAKLLKQAQDIDIEDRRHRTLLLDLKCQLVLREADQKYSTGGSFADYLTRVETLASILSNDERDYLDEKLLRTIERIRFHTARGEGASVKGDLKVRLEKFDKWIRSLR